MANLLRLSFSELLQLELARRNHAPFTAVIIIMMAIIVGSYKSHLQSTILGEMCAFSVQKFGNCHWLTISNIGCPAGTINVYDSLPNSALQSHTKRQIAAILFIQNKEINVNFIDVQNQTNGNDCGVYSIAFSTSLCAGLDPSELYYRNHCNSSAILI